MRVTKTIYNPEGYVYFEGNPMYNYFRRDHLGNICEVWQANRNLTVQRINYYPSGLPWNSATGTGAGVQNKKYNGKEFIEMHGLDEYDSEARWYYPAIMRTTTLDPLAEKYYSISPYAWCGNNPVRFIDPDGREVVAIDKESQRNITNTLSEEESKYVRFRKDGTLDTKKLNKSKSESENMTALKTLANSDAKYNFIVATADGDGNDFFDRGDGNFYYGITMMPNTEGAPTGTDGNVWVYTGSFLSEEKQAENTAHEGYGHALFYEKSRTDDSYDPFHRHVTQGSVVWNEEFKTNEFVSTRVDSNTKLDHQIKKVVTQTRVNYEKRTKK